MYVNFGKLNLRWKIGLIEFERYSHTKLYRLITYSGLHFGVIDELSCVFLVQYAISYRLIAEALSNLFILHRY